jgi:Di-haem oxidoreductase, putative peroxidase
VSAVLGRLTVPAAAVVIAAGIAGAVGWADATRGGPRSTARVTGAFSPRGPADTRAEAEEALERDAILREERFLEAVQPGRAFASTRVSEAEIEAGRWSATEVFALGAQLFHLTFTREVGLGARDLPPLARFHQGRRGGPDAFRCDSCHWRGGPAGAGDAADDAYLDGDGNAQSSALGRNPIALAGAGLLEILAAEMNAELGAQRAALRRTARWKGPTRGELHAKGVSFGQVTVRADGTLDDRELAGVDADLVIKPFGWKGNVPTVRDAVEDALLIHHGMESEHLVKTAPKERIGPFGGADPDGDGIVAEIVEGQVTALTLFVAMQEIPQVATPADANMMVLMAAGRSQFVTLGCASCHVPSLPLGSTVFRLKSRDGGRDLAFDLAAVGAEPRIAPETGGTGARAYLYSDLKRHDLGPGLAETREDRGVPGKMFLTRPLWGVARSRPYLHDGRAATMEDAILLHGGEAQEARDAYAKLKDSERAPVRVFLTSLTRARRLVVR